MSIDAIIGSLIAIVVGGVLGGWQARVAINKIVAEREKTLQETKNIKAERENTLMETIDRQDKKIDALRKEQEENEARIVELERSRRDFENYVSELLFGIDVLTRQIVEKHNDVPAWTPKRRKEDK